MKAIASLRGQSYANWEHIVVDDGDGEGKNLIEGLGEARVRAFLNRDKGQVSARNLAIQESRGELVALLDDDDWFDDPFHLEKVVSVLETDALVHRHGWVVVEEGHERDWQLFDLPASAESLRKDNSILTSSMAYPKHFHNELGLFDEEIGGYFDWDWIIRILDAAHPIKTIESPGVCYLVHKDSGSANVEGERRTESFKRFKEKHQLDIQLKNHSLLLSQHSE